jgi:hypothetical protein
MNSTHCLPYLTCDLTQPTRALHYYMFNQIRKNNTVPKSSPLQESRVLYCTPNSCDFKLYPKLKKLKYQHHHVDDLRTVETIQWRVRSTIDLKIQHEYATLLQKLLSTLLSSRLKLAVLWHPWRHSKQFLQQDITLLRVVNTFDQYYTLRPSCCALYALFTLFNYVKIRQRPFRFRRQQCCRHYHTTVPTSHYFFPRPTHSLRGTTALTGASRR